MISLYTFTDHTLSLTPKILSVRNDTNNIQDDT